MVEGSSRPTTKDFVRFLEIARSSGTELHFAIVVCGDLDLGSAAPRADLSKQLESSQKQVSALIKALRQRSAAGTRR